MKILFIAGSGHGGSNLSLRNLIIGLKTLNYEIEIVTPNKDTNAIFEDLCKTHMIAYRPHIWPSLNCKIDYYRFLLRMFVYSYENIIAYLKMLRIAKEFAPDVIHTNTSIIKIGYSVAHKLNIKHVWHVREYIDEDFNIKPFPTFKSYIKLLQKSQTIAISEDVKDYLSLSALTRVIYNGVFDSTVIPTIRKSKEDYFLYVGALTPKKGVDILIESFSLFAPRNSSTKLLLAGSGAPEYLSHLKNKISRLGLSGRIEFLGQRKDIPQLMNAATGLIVPSYREAFGRITAEAMFYGCLVLGRNTGGTKEQLDLVQQKLDSDYVFRFNNADELYRLMIYVKQNEDNFYSLRQVCQRVVIDSFNITKSSDEINMLYHELVN